jgi:hypothetical protein
MQSTPITKPVNTMEVASAGTDKQPELIARPDLLRVHASVLRLALRLNLVHSAQSEIWVGLIIIARAKRTSISAVQLRDEARTTATALLVRNSPVGPATASASTSPIEVVMRPSDMWDFPSCRFARELDRTLVDTIKRCAIETTGRGVKQIERGVGVAPYGAARRYEFLVTLDKGETVLPSSMQGKWVDPAECWSYTKRGKAEKPDRAAQNRST